MANPVDQQTLSSALERNLHEEKLRYIEIRAERPLAGSNGAHTYCLHRLDLRPGLSTLFANFHKSSTQRKILRAERENLICETGRSPALLDAFWDLLLLTRRRHGIPPQPKRWFRNLIECFGDALQIRVAYHGRLPVASLLTLRHKDTLMYKYGSSDARFHNLGGIQLLFWRAIQDAKCEGLSTFDLGRTDCANAGLITFKDRWGSARSTISYSRFTLSPQSDSSGHRATARAMRVAKRVIPHLPAGVLRMAGSILYRHIA